MELLSSRYEPSSLLYSKIMSEGCMSLAAAALTGTLWTLITKLPLASASGAEEPEPDGGVS